MWGGVKTRTHYGDLFRAWSATQGLEPLRQKLYREPRPWFLAWSLHNHRHLLSDYHCARMLSWCTSVMELERRQGVKRNAYVYAQEVFQFMVHSHKVGHETFQEYFRLCAAGRDLTMAFRWQQYLVESGKHFDMVHYTWLLCIASLSPNDEAAADMVEGVWEAYLSRYCSQFKHDSTGEMAQVHFSPTTEEESTQLKDLFAAFKNMRERIALTGVKPELLQFIDSLPTSAGENVTNRRCQRSLWPTRSRHHTFVQLEGGVSWNPPTLAAPRLRDSLLHEDFIYDLEDASFAHNVQRVVELLNEYRGRVTAENKRASAAQHQAGERDIWRQFADPTAVKFRRPLVENGGLTAELYHYLIVALAATQPSMALRTLRRMEEAGIRILDLTRVVMIVACEGSAADQVDLSTAQLHEMDERRRVDEDFDVTREVELYWKFQYTEFFHYRNALSRVAFYGLLMEGLGPVRTRQLILEARKHDTGNADDVVVLDDAFRTAVAQYYRRTIGPAAVETALDEITQHIPNMDISLVGSIQHFSNYVLPADDYIATDVEALRKKIAGFRSIYVIDASFVESSEYFLRVGSEPGAQSPSLVLVPYCCLQQLDTTVSDSQRVVSFDESLREASRTEPFIASQRLRALFARLASGDVNNRFAVLHFSECLLAHAVDILPQGLDPVKCDNDHLLLVLAMVRAMCPSEADVICCADDPQLVHKLKNDTAVARLFAAEVRIMTSEPSKEAVVDMEKCLINDNPYFDIPSDFEPKMEAHARVGINANESTTVNLPNTALSSIDTDAISSAWLDMLNDEDDEQITPEPQVNVSPEKTTSSALAVGDADTEAEVGRHTKLMNTYESEHAVVPVGVLMAQASSLGSIFDQFQVDNPDEAVTAGHSHASSRVTPGNPREGRKRRCSVLQREGIRNRGASNRQRYRLARRLSNISGGRVPFNLRYRVLEVDVNDPRNKHYQDAYKEGIAKKRESFKHRFDRLYMVGSGHG